MGLGHWPAIVVVLRHGCAVTEAASGAAVIYPAGGTRRAIVAVLGYGVVLGYGRTVTEAAGGAAVIYPTGGTRRAIVAVLGYGVVLGYGRTVTEAAGGTAVICCTSGTRRTIVAIRVQVGAVLRTSPWPTMISDVHRATRSSRAHYAVTREHGRSGRSGNPGLAPVDRRAQVVVGGGQMLMLPLRGSELDVMVVFGRELALGCMSLDASGASVEAHTVHGHVVDDRLVIDVGNVNVAQVVNGAVVVEISAAPVAALETNSTVSESIVDSAVESDVRTPITAVPQIDSF
jgi:hypothetical protein